MKPHWTQEISGGVAAALAGLPVELAYGLLATLPLGAAWGEHGVRAALWGCVLGGLLGFVLRSTGGMITGSRSSAGLILGGLAASLLDQPAIQAQADPAAMVFPLLLCCTALAGLCQAAFGLAGVGRALKYVPYPVLAGLMAGIALLMAMSAARPFLGLPAGAGWDIAAEAWRPLSLGVGVATYLLCLRAGRLTRRVPAVLVALIGGTLLHHGLALLAGPEALGGTAGSAHGLVPAQMAAPWLLHGGSTVFLHWLPTLLPFALAIAAFASLETLLCLSAIEAATDRRPAGNRELLRQGVANGLIGLAGGTPALGNVSRVMVNLSAGARQPLSGLAYAATLATLVLFAGEAAHWVPQAVTAAILLYYAQGMVEPGVRRMLGQVLAGRRTMPPAQYQVLAANVAVIVLVTLVAAVGHMMQALAAGIVAAMFLFVRAHMRPVIRHVGNATGRRSLQVREGEAEALLEAHGDAIAIVDVDGPLFFGTADRAALEIDCAAHRADWLLLDLSRVREVDPTGSRTLLRLAERLAARGKCLMLCGLRPDVREFLTVMAPDCPQHREHWFDDVDTALAAAEDSLLTRLGANDALRIPPRMPETLLAQGLTESQLACLESLLITRQCAAGERLFRQGDTSDSLFIARDSAVDILLPLPEGRSKRIASIAPGNVFGEMALLEGKPRSADAVLCGASQVWELNTEAFACLRAAHPDIAQQLLFNLSGLLAHRLRVTTGELAGRMAAA